MPRTKGFEVYYNSESKRIYFVRNADLGNLENCIRRLSQAQKRKARKALLELRKNAPDCYELDDKKNPLLNPKRKRDLASHLASYCKALNEVDQTTCITLVTFMLQTKFGIQKCDGANLIDLLTSPSINQHVGLTEHFEHEIDRSGNTRIQAMINLIRGRK